MSGLSLYFLVKWVSDCIWPNTIALQRRQNLDQKCDLEWRPLILLTMTVVTSIFMLAYKLGKIDALRLEFRQYARLREEATRLLGELQRPAAPAAASAAGPRDAVAASSAVAPHPAALGPVPPAAPAPVPAAVAAPAAAGSAAAAGGVPVGVPLGEVRGECPTCKQSVWSTDEGRFREEGLYYHRYVMLQRDAPCRNLLHGAATCCNS
jgi:hypothetical protein